jgi:uncharacterized membrane protein YqiK
MVIYPILAGVLIILATWEKSPFRIYWKAEARRGFVRTGFGGLKAVVGGGALVIPLFHKIQWVDLGETRLVVSRKAREAVITKDPLRADIEAEFYIRVKADGESVKQAATALGRRADNSENLKDFLEPKLIDSLQATVSEMTLEEIHQNRLQFASRIKESLGEDLKMKGLELTSVSLCSLDQTALEFYASNNIFDAEGLLMIKDRTERRRKERNDIELEQALLIETKQVEVRKKSLALEREKAFAERNTFRDIEVQKEETEREITQTHLDQHRQAEESRITHEQSVKEKELVKERYLEEQRILKEQAVQLAEIQKNLDVEKLRINNEKAVQTADIQREIEVTVEKQRKEEADIGLEKAIETLKIDAIRAKKEREIADHEILNIRVRSQAERQKIATVVRAEEEAARLKIEKQVDTENRAFETRTLAQAKFDASDKEAQAIERLSKANADEALNRAKGDKAVIEAHNVVSEHILKNERAMKLIGEFANIASELMKPAEKIESIRVVHIDGLGSSPVDQRVELGTDQSLLSYGGARSAIGSIISGILQVGAFKPVFQQLLGGGEIKDLDMDRLSKIIQEIIPGLAQEAGKELIRGSIRKEQEKREKMQGPEDSGAKQERNSDKKANT